MLEEGKLRKMVRCELVEKAPYLDELPPQFVCN